MGGYRKGFQEMKAFIFRSASDVANVSLHVPKYLASQGK